MKRQKMENQLNQTEQLLEVKEQMDRLFESKKNDHQNVLGNFRAQDIVTTFMYKNDNPNKLIVIVLKNSDNMEIPVWALNFIDFYSLYDWICKNLK